jgi:hypothetical protein
MHVEDRAAIAVLGLLVILGAVLRGLLMGAQNPGFISITDSTYYLVAAHLNVFVWAAQPDSSPWPAGYPAFVRLLYVLDENLSFAMLAQHVMGIGTALIWFLTVRRVTTAWWGLLPAAVILFAGPQLFLEHAPMAESLFAFLIATACYVVVRSSGTDLDLWGLAVAGIVLACAACVRVIGLPLLPLLGAWMLICAPGALRQRLSGVAAIVAAAGLVFGIYLIDMKHTTGYGGPTLTRSGNWRGPPPSIGRFKAASFPERVGRDLTRFWGGDDQGARGGFSYERLADIMSAPVVLNTPLKYSKDSKDKPSNNLTRWYPTATVQATAGLLGFMRDYERATRVEGVAFLLLLLLVVGIPLARGQQLRAGVLVAGVAAATLLTPVVFLYYDARYAIPGYGPLAAAAAIGGAALWTRLIVPRREERQPLERAQPRAKGRSRRRTPAPAQAGR